MGYYEASSGNFLPSFQDKLSPHLQGSRIHGPIGCAETSTRNYHYSLRNNPEESSSHLSRGGSLKLHTPPTCCPLPAERFFLLLHIAQLHLQLLMLQEHRNASYENTINDFKVEIFYQMFPSIITFFNPLAPELDI